MQKFIRNDLLAVQHRIMLDMVCFCIALCLVKATLCFVNFLCILLTVDLYSVAFCSLDSGHTYYMHWVIKAYLHNSFMFTQCHNGLGVLFGRIMLAFCYIEFVGCPISIGHVLIWRLCFHSKVQLLVLTRPFFSGADIATSLSKIQDRVQIFFAVLFWMSLFFWASAWDGRNRPNKGSRFRR